MPFTIFAKLVSLSGFPIYQLTNLSPCRFGSLSFYHFAYPPSYIFPDFPIYRTFRYTVLPVYRFSACGSIDLPVLAYLPVYHFSHNPSDLGYPTGSAFPGGAGYSSRRAAVVGRNPDGVCTTPSGGSIFSGMTIEVGVSYWVGFAR